MPRPCRLALLLCAVLAAPDDVVATAPQLPGARPPAPPPPPPPADPAKAAAEARAAAERAAAAARDAAKAASRPAVPPLSPPPARAPAGELGRADCALVVLSAELADKGNKDIKLLYDFAEGAGAYLPRDMVADRYKEIVVLDRGNAKLSSFFVTLDRLTKSYRAVDAIIHCHGEPFQLLWDDFAFDVHDAACQADATLRSAFVAKAPSAGVQVRLGPPDSEGVLSAKDAGGSELSIVTSTPGLAERFRIFDLDGGTLRDGDRVQVATGTGHYWVAQGGGGATWRADSDNAGQWETFFVVLPSGSLTNRGTIGFKTQGGQYLGLDRGMPTARATAFGPRERWTVRLLSQAPDNLPVVPLTPEQRSRLRFCLETACYGSSHAPGWRKLGFQAVAGARGVHCDSACSFPTFLAWWRNGYSFAECIDAANRADRGRAWDAWARQQGFPEVDSQRLVRGLGSLDYSSRPNR